jgi:membrane protein
MTVKNFGELLKDTFNQWKDRSPFNGSIIIAYYTIFSLPGLLVIIINIAGFFYDKKEITTQITSQIQMVMGGDTAKDLESIITKSTEKKESVISSILGIITLLFGATGVFYELQQLLNIIWSVKPKPRRRQKIWVLVRDRLFSFGLILVVGFLLLVSLVLSTALTALSGWLSTHLSTSFRLLFSTLDLVISLGIITFLFAAIFKFLPDVKIAWRDAWVGAFITAILFVIAKFGLGLYFGHSNIGSAYGAAGSIILIMLWVSYVGLILLFGAELTQVYISKRGKKAEPTSIAVST